MNEITIIGKDEPRISSLELAGRLGLQHESVFKLVNAYQADFEDLGKVRFQIGASAGSKTGQKTKFALLNEDQCYLLLAYAKNTSKARALKLQLVKAFRDARRQLDIHKVEYLPTYHALHDGINALAVDSDNKHFVHSNFNKLINKTVGAESGQRAKLPLPQRSMLIVAQSMAMNALQGCKDHHDGYARAKAALGVLTAAMNGAVANDAMPALGKAS